jgi:hypothetical protein
MGRMPSKFTPLPRNLMSCSLHCPTCNIKCSFPHGSDQEDFLKNIMPEGCSFHECIGGHRWTEDNLGEIAVQTGIESISNVAAATQSFSNVSTHFPITWPIPKTKTEVTLKVKPTTIRQVHEDPEQEPVRVISLKDI